MRDDLARLVGAEHVAAASAADVQDDSHVAGVRARDDALLVRPAHAEQVAAVVAWCYEREVPVVPRGGGTGYAGGAVPVREGSVVLSVDRAVASVREASTSGTGTDHEAGERRRPTR